MHRRLLALYALFALSGFSGLIYESIWSHYLKLFVGHAAYAQTLVLAVFMGGMGLGAWLTARVTHRIGNLLWAYAAVELVIGLAALAFHPLFVATTDWAYASLLPATCGGEGLCLSQWLLAALLVLPQSVLLGSTFPLMSGGVLRLAPELPGRRLAMLYFLNSIGAVVGVLASGFVLIPAAGLPGALLAAGVGNLVVAIGVYFVGKPAAGAVSPLPPARATPATAEAPASTTLPPLVRTLLLVSLLTGLSSFIYEIAWIRMLSMVFGSATHSFEIMLAAFILGLALGGLWVRHRIDQVADTRRLLGQVQVVMGLCALATMPLYAWTFDAMAWLLSGLARNEAGYALFTLALKVLALVVMLPATVCAGMTLPLITVQLYRGSVGERALGQVYAANTLGAIAGVLLAVHLLLPLLGLKWALAIGAAIDIALGAWMLAPRRRPALAWGAAGVAALVAVPALASFDALRMGAGVFREGRARLPAGTEVVYARDGKTATVHVMGSGDGTRALATNGKTDGAVQMKPGGEITGDEITMTMLGALPLVYKPDAATVAVIGFGTGMSSTVLLGSPALKQLDTVEIEPAIVEAAAAFKPMNQRAYDDPRHRIVIDDAKSFFTRGQRRYDVIVSEPSNPWVSGVASLFTEEFYARARQHLNPGGLLVQWLQVYEITPELVASVFGALQASFPVYDVHMGSSGDMVLVAGAGPQLPPRRDAVFAMPQVAAMLRKAGIENPNHLALQFVADQRTLAPLVASYGMPRNSDYFPLVDLQGPRARFLRASTTPWTLLHTAEVPMLRALDGLPLTALQGDAPPSNLVFNRLRPYAKARQLRALVQDGALPPAGQSHLSDVQGALVLHNRLFACAGAGLQQLGWDGVLVLATETLPYLGPDDGAAFWRAIRDSRCTQQFSEHQRRWLALLVQVAEGRWRDAGAAAEGLLGAEPAPSVMQRAVLVKIAATALIAARQGGAADRLLQRELPKLPEAEHQALWVRWLRAQASLPTEFSSPR